MAKNYLVINGEEYNINNILLQNNLLGIAFTNVNDIPNSFHNVSLFQGETQIGSFVEYDTVYRIEGNLVWLSNDGSVYEAPIFGESQETQGPSEEQIAADRKFQLQAQFLENGPDVQEELIDGITEVAEMVASNTSSVAEIMDAITELGDIVAELI